MIDMRGYRVAYGNSVYDCLFVEIVYGDVYSWDTPGIGYPTELRVHIIDHAAKLATIRDEYSKFNFLKDGK